MNSIIRVGRLAQLVRASDLHSEGQRFESSTAHHNSNFNFVDYSGFLCFTFFKVIKFFENLGEV